MPLPGERKPELQAPPEDKLVEHKDLAMIDSPQGDKVRIKELEERCLRLQAEFENYKKRAIRENDAVRENASADVMLRLLPIADEFEIAVAHMDKASAKEFKQGIELIYAKLLDLLKREQVEAMKSMGERFDPYKHDAIRASEGEEGKIVEVVQKGYSYKGKILRHAKVVVGKGKEGKQ